MATVSLLRKTVARGTLLLATAAPIAASPWPERAWTLAIASPVAFYVIVFMLHADAHRNMLGAYVTMTASFLASALWIASIFTQDNPVGQAVASSVLCFVPGVSALLLYLYDQERHE